MAPCYNKKATIDRLIECFSVARADGRVSRPYGESGFIFFFSDDANDDAAIPKQGSSSVIKSQTLVVTFWPLADEPNAAQWYLDRSCLVAPGFHLVVASWTIVIDKHADDAILLIVIGSFDDISALSHLRMRARDADKVSRRETAVGGVFVPHAMFCFDHFDCRFTSMTPEMPDLLKSMDAFQDHNIALLYTSGASLGSDTN
jgi:hypothetical protein